MHACRRSGTPFTQIQKTSPSYPLRLMVVVAATIAALALAWARNGAIAGLLDGVLDHVRALFGIA
jgi:hypothetical protein